MLIISTWSKPFVKATIILLFIGSSIGSVWMLTLSGYSIGIPSIFALHKELQTGAITLLIMGVMYMLIPRIRSIRFTYVRETRISFILMIVALIMHSSTIIAIDGRISTTVALTASIIRLTAIALFSTLVLLMLRIAPKVGRVADYYFILALLMMMVYNTLHTLAIAGVSIGVEPLNLIYIWIASVMLTIFGVQYKVVPVFFSQSTPMKGIDKIALASSLLSSSLLLSQLFLAAITAMIVSTLAFAHSIYIMRRLTIPEFLYTSDDPQAEEKIARLRFFTTLLRISYAALLLGLIFALLYAITPSFSLYDLAIHIVTMGFIGITIMNFMPIMIPPIIGRNVNYTRFNMIPLLVLLSSIALRISWNLLPYIVAVERVVFGISGIVAIAAMLLYINMLHRSMDKA
ncbi:MAG: hypothetical protein ACK4FV_00590 [Candidatus Nitrosocaldus sp.]